MEIAAPVLEKEMGPAEASEARVPAPPAPSCTEPVVADAKPPPPPMDCAMKAGLVLPEEKI